MLKHRVTCRRSLEADHHPAPQPTVFSPCDTCATWWMGGTHGWGHQFSLEEPEAPCSCQAETPKGEGLKGFPRSSEARGAWSAECPALCGQGGQPSCSPDLQSHARQTWGKPLLNREGRRSRSFPVHPTSDNQESCLQPGPLSGALKGRVYKKGKNEPP